MIISPPFLPLKDTPVYSEEDVRTLMPNAAPGNGFFPVSQAMAWHGGMHFTATSAEEAVRAIADGVLVFRRDAELVRYNAQDHSTGCVVLRHTTEIGAQGDTATKVVFYSIYQHLRTLDKELPAVGQPVYRKDKLGLAGFIHGIANRIHLEIVSGDADTQKLLGRSTGDLDLTRDGRSDAVYGQIYVLLPAQSPCYASDPRTANNSAPSGNSGAEQLVIGIQYALGQAALTTYKLTGEVQGTAVLEKDAEYNLYVEATQRHNNLRANLQTGNSATALPDSSPSGWYELLRFGRNLGPDPLPSNAAHWRKVSLPSQAGAVWVDLNAAGTKKFSDADFPHWMGWKLVDDDTEDSNSQCNSAMIDSMLAPVPQASPTSATPSLSGPSPQAAETASTTKAKKAANRLQNLAKPAVQSALSKTICKFPTEWANAEVRTRWTWVREQGNPYIPYPLEDEIDFTEMSDFAQKLCFWEELPEEDKNRLTMRHWHFNSREFIVHFRRCGWLSENELASVLKTAPKSGLSRANSLRNHLNGMQQKYLINTSPLRSTHFLAQVGHETGWWQYREELGNERYFRTLYEIITSSEATEDYRSGLAQRLDLVQKDETEQSYSSRRPNAVATKAQSMDNGLVSAALGGMAGDGPRFRGRGFLQITGRRNYSSYGKFRGQDFTTDPKPVLLASNNFNACDASGFYWSRERTNLEADAGYAARNITRVGGIINRGSANKKPLHDTERQNVFLNIWRKLNDKTTD